MPGQIRLRVRFGRIIGEWFDYLLVSPKEMETLLSNSGWQIERLIGSGEPSYFAIIRKRTGGEVGERRVLIVNERRQDNPCPAVLCFTQ